MTIIDKERFMEHLRKNGIDNKKTMRVYYGYALDFYAKYMNNLSNIYNISEYLADKRRSYTARFGIKWLYNYLKLGHIFRRFEKRMGKKFKQKARKKDVGKKYLTKNELSVLLNSLKPFYSLMARTQYNLACRVESLVNIRRMDIEIVSDDKLKVFLREKGDKMRTLFITGEAVQPIISHIQNREMTDLVFINGRRKPDTMTRAYNRELEKAGKRLFSKGMSSHWLRRSRAIHLTQANVDIKSVQKLLGHSDVKTTDLYIQEAGMEIEKLIDRVGCV